jgi:hypothetical protein
MKMKNLLILALIIALPMMYINAADATADKKPAAEEKKADEPKKVDEPKKAEPKAEAKKPAGISFPGKVELSTTTKFAAVFTEGQGYGSKCSSNVDSYSGSTISDPLSFQQDFNAKITFTPVQQKLFTFGITPYIKDSFDFINDVPGTTKLSSYSAVGTWAAAKDAALVTTVKNSKADDPTTTTYFIPRNRAYFGFETKFSVPKIIDINANCDFRIENKATSGNRQTEAAGLVTDKNLIACPATILALTPALNLGGSYDDIGLSWGLKDSAEMQFYPGMFVSTNFTGTDWNGKRRSGDLGVYYCTILKISPNVDFNFMKFVGIKDIKGSVTVSNDFQMTFFDAKYVLSKRDITDAQYGTTQTNIGEWAVIKNTFTAGLKFDLWGITPNAAIRWTYFDAQDTDPCTANWQWLGFVGGVGVKAGSATIDLSYEGRYNIIRGNMVTTTDTFKDDMKKMNSKWTYEALWENMITGSLSIKL